MEIWRGNGCCAAALPAQPIIARTSTIFLTWLIMSFFAVELITTSSQEMRRLSTQYQPLRVYSVTRDFLRSRNTARLPRKLGKNDTGLPFTSATRSSTSSPHSTASSSKS